MESKSFENNEERRQFDKMQHCYAADSHESHLESQTNAIIVTLHSFRKAI